MFSTKETSRNKKVLATADEAICQVFVSGNEMTGVSCWTESCSYQLSLQLKRFLVGTSDVAWHFVDVIESEARGVDG